MMKHAPHNLAERSCYRRCSSIGIRRKKSGRQDSNLRPRAPGARALRKLSYTLKKLGEQDSNLRISRLTIERLTSLAISHQKFAPVRRQSRGNDCRLTQNAVVTSNRTAMKTLWWIGWDSNPQLPA